MIKKAILIIVQLFLFYLVFLGGTLLDPLKMKWFITHPTPLSTRFFVPDGLLIAFALFVLILIIEAAAKRLRTAGASTSIAFLVAVLLGILSKFGWATHDLF